MTVGIVPWAEVIFPVWVLVLSLHILLVAGRTAAGTTSDGAGEW